MKHLLEFDSYSPMDEAEVKAGVPVYNEDEFNKNTSAKPAMVVKVPEIISVLNKFIADQESGEIEKIVVLAEIPSQGKNAPKYVLDDAAAERERQIQRKTAIYGSRTERSDTPEDDEQTDAINIFVDSEFIVKGVINKLGKDYILGIPGSKKKKAESSKEMMDYYTVEIEPRQVFEIFFSPKGM